MLWDEWEIWCKHVHYHDNPSRCSNYTINSLESNEHSIYSLRVAIFLSLSIVVMGNALENSVQTAGQHLRAVR